MPAPESPEGPHRTGHATRPSGRVRSHRPTPGGAGQGAARQPGPADPRRHSAPRQQGRRPRGGRRTPHPSTRTDKTTRAGPRGQHRARPAPSAPEPGQTHGPTPTAEATEPPPRRARHTTTRRHREQPEGAKINTPHTTTRRDAGRHRSLSPTAVPHSEAARPPENHPDRAGRTPGRRRPHPIPEPATKPRPLTSS